MRRKGRFFVYINIEKMLISISRDLLKEKGPGIAELKRADAQTLRLQSQLLSLIYDADLAVRCRRNPLLGRWPEGRTPGPRLL